MLNVKPVPAFKDNYIWLIINSASKAVAIVDPGDAAPVIRYIEEYGLKPAALLITHHHPDHIGGISGILGKYDVPVYGPATEKIPHMTMPLQEGATVELDELDARFMIYEVPGHTSGHIAYYGDNRLFIGDTLFLSGCGRLFEGTAEQMYHSLNKIAALPDTTEIYCAHEYTLANLRFARAVEPHNNDIKERIDACEKMRTEQRPTVPGKLVLEKKTNPFLRVTHIDVIVAAERHAGYPLRNNIEVFAAIRSWKDNF